METLRKTFRIKAPVSKVWEALTTPAIIKQYFFGTDAVSDWKEGSMLYFRGEWEGKPYEDKGRILKSEAGKVFTYNYWSSMSGKPDVPENYAVVSYELAPAGDHTDLTIVQDGIATVEALQHSEKNWSYIVEQMKQIIEA